MVKSLLVPLNQQQSRATLCISISTQISQKQKSDYVGRYSNGSPTFLHFLQAHLTALCSGLNFQGYLYSKQPWKTEIVSTPCAKSRFAYSPERYSVSSVIIKYQISLSSEFFYVTHPTVYAAFIWTHTCYLHVIWTSRTIQTCRCPCCE